MKKNPNYQGGTTDAYAQFINDLKQDKDFIDFKNKALNTKEGYSYGVVIVRTNRFTIEKTIKPFNLKN